MKTQEEIAKIREACKIVSNLLGEIGKRVQPGVTPHDLDEFAKNYILSIDGASPTFLGYQGYPAVLCVSVNAEVVHGIPSKRKLERGDIVSIDVGVTKDGYIGDSAFTFAVGKILPARQRLMDVTMEALYAGIAQAKAGNFTGNIGNAVQKIVEANGYNVVRDFCGHGVGTHLHEEPQVWNFGEPGEGTKLEPGMVIAIEPMVNMGTHEVKVANDNWTVITKDRKPSAHFEHTVLVTEGEPEILTNFDFMAR